MNKPKEGRGAISAYAAEINVLDIDDLKGGIEASNKMEKEVANELQRQSLKKNENIIDNRKNENMDTFALREEAKEFVESNGIDRE